MNIRAEHKPLPPANLEELCDLYVRISSGDHPVRLTRRSLAVLKSMLDSPGETAVKSISEVARENGVHISSITRLAQKLGFEGFQGLKTLFRTNLARQRSFYSEQVKRFLQLERRKARADVSILEQVIQDEWSNVMVMNSSFDDKKFTAIVDLIARAEHVLVLGLRGSYPAAYYLSFYMQMIRERVTLVGKAGHMLGEDLSLLRPGGLLIAISQKPYTRETVNACRVCRQQGLELAAITDSISSPLATETDNLLVAAIQGSNFFSPIAAVMICVEALLSELVVKLGDEAIARLNHAEMILDKLGIEI